MALFTSLGGGGGGLSVGSVTATLGYDHDTRGLRQWDRSVEKARRDSRKKIEQDLGADFDRRGFDQYNRAADKAQRNNSLVGRSAAVGGRGLLALGRGAVVAGGALGVAFFYGTKKAVEASSDLNESVSASEQIFESNSAQIQRWSKGAADDFGFARSEALQFASSIGAMLKPIGVSIDKASEMSTTLVELAGDMASFNNEDPSEMLERIRSGLAGESEPLRRFGVDLRVTALEAFALNRGLLEQGEKLEGAKLTMVAYQKILSDTKDQQGDFGRTSEGLANVQRRLRANTIDLLATFGDVFRPLVQGAANDVNDFVVQMKNGTGAGGDFRRFLEGAGKDVEHFVGELEDVLSDKSLDPGEKAEKIFGKFADVATDAISAATPAIANAAAEAAPAAAAAFVRSFVGADSWGRLALGAILISKLGGFGALRGAGGRAGGGFTEGVLGGILGAGGAAGGGKGGGLAGGLRSVLGRAGPVAKRIGVLGLGLTIGDSVLSAIDQRVREGSEDIGVALEAMTEDVKLGPIGIDRNALGFEAETLQAERLEGLFKGMTTQRIKLASVQEKEIEFMAREVDLTGEAAEIRDRMFKLLKLGRGLDVAVDLSMDPKDLQGIRRDLDLLRRGVFTSAEDIDRASKRAQRSIVDNFGAGTKEGRRLTAENLRATAAAYARAMDESGNHTKKGLDRIRNMIRTADLVQGIRPGDFGKAFARSFAEAGRVTETQLDKIIEQMNKMPKGARQAAYNTMNEQLVQYRKGGRLSKEEVKKIRSRILSEFGTIKTKSVGSTFDLVTGVLKNFGSLGSGIAAGLDVIKENTNKGLGAFGVDPVKWVLKKVGSLLGIGGSPQRQARGGFLQGPSRGDVVPVLAGADEAFVTSWQQQPINAALQFSAAAGVQPYPHLAALFAGEQKTHSTGPPVKRAQGGYAGPYKTRDDVLGSGAGFIPYMNYLNSMFGPLTVISGLRPGSITTSGNVSNHARGAAVDISTPGIEGVTGPGDLAAAPADSVGRMDAAHSFIGSHFQPILLDFLWRTFTGGNHYNHIHSGIEDAFAFDAQRMMEFISHLPRGGSFGAIPRVLLQGPEGVMREWGQAQLDQVRDAANEWRSRQAGFGVSAFPGDPHDVPKELARYNRAYPKHSLYETSGRTRFSEGLTDTIGRWAGLPSPWAGQVAHGESSFYPGIYGVDPGGTVGRGLWAITSGVGNDAMIERYGGPEPAMFNPFINAMVAKEIYDLNGPGAWYGTKYVTGAARGGWARAAKGGLAGKIRGLYKELSGTKRGTDKAHDLEDEIDRLEEKLTRKRRQKQRVVNRKIEKQGKLKGWRDEIAKRQTDVEAIDDSISGMETTHGLTEPREVEDVLAGMGLDRQTDLSTLSAEQRSYLLGAIDSDFQREERERDAEVRANQRSLDALLSERRVLIRAIQDAEGRIKKAEKAAKKAEEEEARLRKKADEIKEEIEQLQKDLSRLEAGDPPKRQKGEKKEDYEAKVKAWKNNKGGELRKIKDTIDRKGFQRRDLTERADGWQRVAAQHRENLTGFQSFLEDDARPTLKTVQGIGRTMELNVKLEPLGVGAPQFGGEILETQAQLASLGATDFTRTPVDFSAGGGAGGEADQLKEEKALLEHEELERYRRLERVMAAQAPVFASAIGFPKLLARGGFAGVSQMVAPFVGSYRVGSEFVTSDGVAIVHRGEKIQSAERVVEGGGAAGDVYVLASGELAPLLDLIRFEIVDELAARGAKATAARRRPAAGVLARKAP